MYIAYFLVCTSPAFYDCTAGVITKDVFLTEQACRAVVQEVVEEMVYEGMYAVGNCARIAGEAA